MFVAGRGWMLRRMGLLQREKNQKLSHPDSSSPKSIRQRPPGTTAQNNRFGGVPRAWP